MTHTVYVSLGAMFGALVFGGLADAGEWWGGGAPQGPFPESYPAYTPFGAPGSGWDGYGQPNSFPVFDQHPAGYGPAAPIPVWGSQPGSNWSSEGRQPVGRGFQGYRFRPLERGEPAYDVRYGSQTPVPSGQGSGAYGREGRNARAPDTTWDAARRGYVFKPQFGEGVPQPPAGSTGDAYPGPAPQPYTYPLSESYGGGYYPLVPEETPYARPW